MKNEELAKIFKQMALYLEMDEVPFKPRAYDKAAEDIASLDDDIRELYKSGGLKALDAIPSVGKGIAERIEEYLKHGKIKEYERLKKKLPVKLEELVQVEGVGPKTVKQLYKKLKIKTLAQLEKAAKQGKIRKLAGFGKKSEEKILASISFLKQSGGRRPLGFVLPAILELEEVLKKSRLTDKVALAGSVRRWKETIGDIDLLVTSKKPKEVMNFFVSLPMVASVVAKGPTKTLVRLKNGLEADLRVVSPRSFGAALQYFTGNKDHNIEIRKIAQKKGYKLNEYGLFRDQRRLAGKSEEEIYRKLGLAWMEPELRTASGEIEAAKTKKLPRLIKYGSLKGDLQIQTTWTDGANSIEEMARAAHQFGLEYIVITDHTKSLAMTGGADEKKLRRQMKEIDKINKKLKKEGLKFTVLKGAEVNILRDGSLDIKDEVLRELDVVGVAVHSHFKLSKLQQTKRIVRAMENPHVDILFHPTGRIINRRAAYEIDIDEIIKTAKKTGTILEIDAYANRLDLKDEHVRAAIATGVKLAIDSDAHATSHLDYLELGIAQARRGWATKKDIINAWPLERMLSFLKDAKAKKR